jgi:hypothetical protein
VLHRCLFHVVAVLAGFLPGDQQVGQGRKHHHDRQASEDRGVRRLRGIAASKQACRDEAANAAEPSEPPMLRMLAFMPLATPVWCGGTASTIGFDIAAKASPKPPPKRAMATATCHTRSCAMASRIIGETVSAAPNARTGCAPNLVDIDPDAEPSTNMASDIRKHQESGFRDARPEAIAHGRDE